MSDNSSDDSVKIAKQYQKRINLETKMPFIDGCSYHLYWILVKNRNQFIKSMTDNNIQVGIHYKPVHQMSLYKNKVKLPITEQMGKTIVSLPMHPNLSNSDIDRVVDSVNKFAN